MKKINFLFVLFFMAGFCALKAQSVSEPDPGQKYSILQKASGLNLGYNTDATNAQIQEPNGSSAQQIIFEMVPDQTGVFYIKTADNKYLHKLETSGWDTRWTDDPTTQTTLTNAHFRIEVNADDNNYVFIRNLTTNSGLGTDGTTSGSAIYSNKNGGDPKFLWRIVVFTEGVQKHALEAIIQTAQTFLDSTTPGTAPGEYPLESYQAFQTAIAEAQAVYDDPAATQEGVNEAITILKGKLDLYQTTIIKFTVDPTKEYNIIHSSTMFLAPKGNNCGIFYPAGTEEQVFVFVEVEGEEGFYNIKNKANGQYIGQSGYYTVWSSDPTSDATKFCFFLVESAGYENYVIIKCKANSRCLGTDANTDNSGVFTDKGGNDVRHYWLFSEYDASKLITIALEKAIVDAEKVLNGAVVGDGPHEYTQEVYDTFAGAIAAAKTALESATTQNEISDAFFALKEAQTTFGNSKNPVVFVWEENSRYRIAVRKYSAKFLTHGADNNTAKSTAEWGTANSYQHWELVPVEGAEYTYYLKNEGKYLAKDFSMTENLAAAQMWEIRHATTLNGIEYFGVLADGNVMTASGGNTMVLQSFNTGNDAHQTRITKVDLPHDPKKFDLENYAFYNAVNTLNSKIIGTEIGQWPQSAYNTFKTAIDLAKGMVNGSGNTQEDVDAMLQALKDAEQIFNDSKIGADKEGLKAKLDEFNEALNGAVIGNQTDQYKWSIVKIHRTIYDEAYAKYLKLTSQEEIDAEIDVVTQNIIDFQNAANTSEIPMADVLEEIFPDAYLLHDNAIAGIDQDEYLASVKVAYKNLLDELKEAEANQETFDSLFEAMENFKNAAIKTDRSSLRAAIARAEAKLESAVEGDKNGQYGADAIDALERAIEAAGEILNDEDLTTDQAPLNAAVTALNAAVTEFDGKKVVINFTALNAAISAAEKAYNDNNNDENRGEGSGQIPSSSFDTLMGAINAAKKMTTDDKNDVNQATVDNEIASLQEAVNAFISSRTPVDKSVLNALIETVERGLANEYAGKEISADLANELANSKAVSSNPDATQTEVNSARSKLNRAWSLFVQSVGIESGRIEGLKVFTDNGLLYINNAPERAEISVYTISGALLINQANSGTEVTFPLKQGIYIVKIQADTRAEMVKVYVK